MTKSQPNMVKRNSILQAHRQKNERRETGMKILLISNYFYPEHIGGVEIVSYNLVKCYRQFGHSVRWVAADVPPKFRKIERDDIPIRAWNFAEEKFGFPQPIPFPDAIIKLYRGIFWCDVVHLHDCLYLINILAFLIVKALGKPLLVTQHTEIIPYKNRIIGWSQSLALRTIGALIHKYANRSVFISENTRDNLPFITRHARHPVVVQNGVDTEFYKPLPDSVRNQFRRELCGDPAKPILLFVGRFVAIKGIQHLVPLIEKHRKWHWLLVGRADEYDPSSWNYPNVTYKPSLGLEEMRIAYSIADLSIHPSEVVGMSLTVLECMACGTPVVVNESALYEVPREDYKYFVLARPDSKNIEEVVISLIKERERLKDLASRVRDYAVKRMSWQEVSGRYLNLLENLI